MELNSLSDVFIDELGLLYDAERQLVDGLPGLAAAAHSYELRDALEGHAGQTGEHIARLEQLFGDIGIRFAPSKKCGAMAGLLEDAGGVVEAAGDSVAIDAALIAAAQRIEQYEIAAYETARELAGELHLDTAKTLLDATAGEEGKAYKALAKLAGGGVLSSGINHLAAARDETEHVAGDEPVRA